MRGKTAQALLQFPAGTAGGPTIQAPHRRAMPPDGLRSSSSIYYRAEPYPCRPRPDNSRTHKCSHAAGLENISEVHDFGCMFEQFSFRSFLSPVGVVVDAYSVVAPRHAVAPLPNLAIATNLTASGR